MNVVITGGLSGIGFSMARFFAERGHVAHVTTRTRRDVPGLIVYELDLTKAESIKAFVENLDLPKIDMLINNAGSGVLGPLTELTPKQVRSQFEANLFGPMELVSRLLPRLHGGRLVNVSSISPEVGLPFGGAYTASKAAMNSVSDIWRLELAHLGIRVTTLRPGLLKTNFAQNADQSLQMKERSSFLKFRPSMMKRASLANQGTDPDAFAQYVCPLLLKEVPPAVIYYGKGAFIFPLLNKVIPRGLKEKILLKNYELL